MKSYSLSTLLLLMVVVALILSQLILMQQLRVAREEVNDVRRKFGYIHVVDQSKTYVALIEENEKDGTAFRIFVPKGSHYVLHLTDATFDSNECPADPIPTTSISLKDGSKVRIQYSLVPSIGRRTVRARLFTTKPVS